MAEPFVLAFTDADDLARRIEEYFDSRWQTRTITQRDREGKTIEFEEEYMRPPTMAGLAQHLGVVRATLWRHHRHGDNDDIKLVIARALNRIAEFAEEALYTKEGVTGARFALEVNHGYGREEPDGAAAGFRQVVISPAVEADEPLAIPKWGDPEEDDE